MIFMFNNMLSNKHKYSLQRGFLLLLSPFLSFLAVFLKKNDCIVLTASLNNEYNDNSRALFEMLCSIPEFKNKVYFVLNDGARREKLNEKYRGRFISNLGFSNIIFILRAKYWVCSALELPVSGLFQRFQRKVYHLGHGMLYKRVGLREKNVSWYKKLYYFFITSNFSYTIATTEIFINEVSLGFGVPENRVLLTPQPKTAQVASPEPIENTILKSEHFTHVLYAPTWRPYADVQFFPFFDLDLIALSSFLKSHGVYIWIRVHPRFEQNIDDNILELENIQFFSGNEYLDVNRYLVYFDALITDYSSIYFDYLTLERPVLFFDYDIERYKEEVGVVEFFDHIKCSETINSQACFIKQLENIKLGVFDLDPVILVNRIVNYDIPNFEIKEFVVNKLFGAD